MRLRQIFFTVLLVLGLNLSPWGNETIDAQQIVAHRGASHQAPENTLAAFRLAWELGADAIEGDFHLTRDGHIVCIHDKSTGKVARVNKVVAESDLSELRQLDVGSWKNARYADERIPTLQEVFRVVPEGKQILVEIKCGPEIVPPLVQILREKQLKLEQITVIAFRDDVIRAVNDAVPELKTFWLTSYERNESTGEIEPGLESILTTLRECGAAGLDTKCDFAVIDRRFVAALREKGYELHAWTVNESEPARKLKSLGFDSITTDVPDQIRAALDE